MTRFMLPIIASLSIMVGASYAQGHLLASVKVPAQPARVVYACLDPSSDRITEASAPLPGQVCEDEATGQVASSARRGA